MEAILETKTETILQFLGGIRRSLRVTFEEGTWAAWLHDLLKPHTITRDLTRVMARVKAIYRSWGISCTGQQVYALRHRKEWLAKLAEAGVHRRAEFY